MKFRKGVHRHQSKKNKSRLVRTSFEGLKALEGKEVYCIECGGKIVFEDYEIYCENVPVCDFKVKKNDFR